MTMFKIEQNDETLAVTFNHGVYEASVDGYVFYTDTDYETVREVLLAG